MRLHDGQYECTLCGSRLDIPQAAKPRVVIRAASGEPNQRLLLLDGRELHRCAYDDARTGSAFERA